MMFDRPPAGYSLTQEPKGAPFENPPEMNDPAEAARYHLNRLSDPELMEDAMFFLEQGVDIMSLVQGILRGAVMQGQHSIDVSLIIAPVLHEFIKQAADVTDTPYEEGFDDKESKAVIKYTRDVTRAKSMLDKLDIKPDAPQEDMPERSMIVDDDSEDEVMEMMEENLEEIEKEKPMGLMSKEIV